METVAPLASDPAIQAAVVDRVTSRISAELDEVAKRDTLTDRDRYLAVPLSRLLEQYVNETVQSFVTSYRFPEMWEQINRAAHPTVSAVLTEGGTETVSTENGQITLDLAPVVTEVINRLRERGVDIVDRIQVDQLDTTFVIFESEDLATLQDAVRWIDWLAIALPAVALVSLAGALLVSMHRRQTLFWAGLDLAVTMAVFLMLLAFARWWVVDNLPPDAHRDAATSFFETVGRYLRDAARLLGLLGLVVAAVALLTRPGGWLSRERKAARASVNSAWNGAKSRWPGLDQAGYWSHAHRIGLALAVGVACCLLAIAWDPLSASRAVSILLLAAIGFGTLMLLPARFGEVAVAEPNSYPALVGDGTTNARTTPTSPPPRVDARADHVALAGDLSADDVRILRRIAAAVRDSG